MEEISLYIHWPFCAKKCYYCDFNVYVDNFSNHIDFLNFYKESLLFYKEIFSKVKIKSIYFGGGTPSLAPIEFFDGILNEIFKFNVEQNVEITIESNPTSIESDKLKILKKLGINRVSVGIQSFNDKILSFLGRNHSRNEALNSLENIRNCFDNYSLDLIYSFKKQTIDCFYQDIMSAMSFNPKHISLYQLTIELGTKFFSMKKKNIIQEIDENISIEMYKMCDQILANYGLQKYEISNYADNLYQSKHNLNYWKYGNYLGIGPGAHTRISLNLFKILSEIKQRKVIIKSSDFIKEGKSIYIDDILTNKNDTSIVKLSFIDELSPKKWKKRILEDGNGIEICEIINYEKYMREKIITGLRMVKGIDVSDFQSDSYLMDNIKKIQQIGYVIFDSDRCHLKVPIDKLILLDSIIQMLLIN